MCKLIITSHTKNYFDSQDLARAYRRPMASKATLDRYFTLGQSADHSGSLYLADASTTPSKSFPSSMHPQTSMDACWMREVLVVLNGPVSSDLSNSTADKRGKILRVPLSSIPVEYRDLNGAFLLDPSEINSSGNILTLEGSASRFYPFFSGSDPTKPVFGPDGLLRILSFREGLPISPVFRKFYFENAASATALICNDGGSRRLVLEYNEL
jgi:hypothetical protein